MSLEQRIQENLDLSTVPWVKDQDTRLALRLLYSALGHGESAASFEGMDPGHLEDEKVHAQTFFELAERLGGIERPSEPLWALIGYLLYTAPGGTAKEMLTKVLESWVHATFECLRDWGVDPLLFEKICAEEAGHVQERTGLDAEEVDYFESLLQWTWSHPSVSVPTYHLIGAKGVADLASRLAKVSGHSRVRHTAFMLRLAAESEPERVPMSRWDLQRQVLFGPCNPMEAEFEVQFDTRNSLRIEAQVVQAVARAQMRVPEVKRTVRGGRLYRPTSAVVGVRRKHKQSGAVGAIYIPNPHKLSERSLMKRLIKKTRKYNDLDYPHVPYMPELVDLLPPNRSAMMVTFTGAYGRRIRGIGRSPFDKLGLEGNAGTITVGSLGEGYRTWITGDFDHRCFDGEHAVRFMDTLGALL